MRHSKREAEERDRILSTTAAKSKPRGCNRERTRVTLRSVPREAQANRVLRSVSARRKKREADCKKRLKKFLREQSARLAEQGFRERVKTQAALRKRLPKGSVGDALLKQRTSEACSACRSRRKANGSVVRNYVLKRFRLRPSHCGSVKAAREATARARAKATARKSEAKPKAVLFPLCRRMRARSARRRTTEAGKVSPTAQTPLEQQLQQQLQQTQKMLLQLNTWLVNQEAQLLQLQASQSSVMAGRGRSGTFDSKLPRPSQPTTQRMGLVDTRPLGKPGCSRPQLSRTSVTGALSLSPTSAASTAAT